MEIITNKNQILDLISEISKPSILRFDESYFNDIDLIHCVIHFKRINICLLNELMDVDIDLSLMKHSSRILISLNSGINFRKKDLEAIVDIISCKTNDLEYHLNLHFDFDYEDDIFDMSCIFVE